MEFRQVGVIPLVLRRKNRAYRKQTFRQVAIRPYSSQHPPAFLIAAMSVNHGPTVSDSNTVMLELAIIDNVYENIILPYHNMNFPFSDHRTFSRKFPRNFRKNFRKFLGKFLHPHLPPLPTPHTIHPHPIPQTMNPLRTLNSVFSKTQFDCICKFISHTLHLLS